MFGGEEKKLFCMKNKLSGNTHIYNIHTGIKKKVKEKNREREPTTAAAAR